MKQTLFNILFIDHYTTLILIECEINIKVRRSVFLALPTGFFRSSEDDGLKERRKAISTLSSHREDGLGCYFLSSGV
jgi:hypothetical protein